MSRLTVTLVADAFATNEIATCFIEDRLYAMQLLLADREKEFFQDEDAVPAAVDFLNGYGMNFPALTQGICQGINSFSLPIQKKIRSVLTMTAVTFTRGRELLMR
jgi:hypothetical protein